MTLKDGILTAAATDSHRLALTESGPRRNIMITGIDFDVIIPRKEHGRTFWND